MYWRDGGSDDVDGERREYLGRTDSEGRHRLAIDLSGISPPATMSLDAQATVSDVNRQASSSSAAMIAHPSSLYVGVRALERVVERGDKAEVEVVAVARDHLLERQLERNGLRGDDVEISDDVLRLVVTEYTREAGVRNLERELGKLLRKTAARLVADTSAESSGGSADTPIIIDEPALRVALGRAKVHPETVHRTGAPGVASGLAVTGTGGDVLVIEASTLESSDDVKDGDLTLTGQLGEGPTVR
jgi:hypothetical protein